MTAHITADEQRNVRAELDQIGCLMERVFSRLAPLERNDDRVLRAECVMAALSRLSWSLSTGRGSLGLPVKIEAVLNSPQPANRCRPDSRAMAASIWRTEREPAFPGRPVSS